MNVGCEWRRRRSRVVEYLSNVQLSFCRRYNEPQRLEMRNSTSNIAHTKNEPILKESKASPLMSFLGSMKSGTKVFQHFLSKSNLTQIMDDGSYTILIPTDNAFQRWHPIDWGFYPFSVQEFTESVLRNHFLPTQKPLRMNDVKNMDQMAVRTMGGETVLFRGQRKYKPKTAYRK